MNEATQTILAALAREFGGVVGALTAGGTDLAETDASVEPRWVVRIEVGGRADGVLFLSIGHKDAAEITRRVMGLDEAPPDAAIADTILEFGGQAAGSLSQDSVAVGMTFSASASSADQLIVEGARRFRLLLDAEFHPVFEVAGTVESLEAEVVGAETAASNRSAPSVAPSTVSGPGPSGNAPAPRNLDVLMDVELPISVRFGRADMTLAALCRVGPGSVIDLGRSPDDPVELLVSGKVVARGEVVVVAGNYGVRVTEVVSTTERIRSMGA